LRTDRPAGKGFDKGVRGYLVFREHVGKSPEDYDKKLMGPRVGAGDFLSVHLKVDRLASFACGL